MFIYVAIRGIMDLGSHRDYERLYLGLLSWESDKASVYCYTQKEHSKEMK